ncbi:hypothetical protein TrVE_jg2963 [Triparma verrucosa]|uniref:Methyltransferase type 11 domain-containing protein n=1 Tax=Triparma verrucosa TaxID=1606542 RepID=A0A9W7KWB2_9STRA|nr:hypothetical protein TrVE_jg2963 [Triparma verrucosa]
MLLRSLSLSRSRLSTASRDTRRSLVSRSFSSSKEDPPKFDAEMVAVYMKIAEQHTHPKGPWPLMTKAVSEKVGDAPFKMLDIASGMGEPARSIGLALPKGEIIASDVSEDMIVKAEASLKDVPNVTPLLANAEDLSTIDDNSMDIVTCCYGYMFPADKDKALEETFRVLKPGGTLIATTWDRVDMISIAGDIMEAILGHRPPPPPLNPMALSEDGLFESMVVKAGFQNVITEKSTYPFDFGNDRGFQLKCGTLLIKDKIEELGAEEVAEKTFFECVPKYTTTDANGHMILPYNTFQMLTATK